MLRGISRPFPLEKAMYKYTVRTFAPYTGVLWFNGQRVPHMLVNDGGFFHQGTLDLLCHFFRDEADPERKALAMYRPIVKHLFHLFAFYDSWTISTAELAELITLVMCQRYERVNGMSDLQYVSGQRRDTLRQ
jgi:hypothetical protein